MTASLVTSICNSALDRLGQRPVTFSTTGHLASPANNIERMCARNFDSVVKSVLAGYPWNCVTTREELSIDPDNSPAFEFDNRFPFPTDKRVCRLNAVWLGGYEIKTDEDTAYFNDFRIEGQSILTDATEVSIAFVYFPIQAYGETASAFDTRMGSYFSLVDDALIEVFIKKLALELCYYNVGNATLKATLAQDFDVAMRVAVGKNKRENPLRRFANRDLIDVRWSY